MDKKHSNVLIIGAGMAGLSCATAIMQSRFSEAGLSLRLLDKGRGPGGRMAARRAEIGDQTVSFDHGAQYFTARDPAFVTTVAQWKEMGVVAPWPEAGEDAFVGVPGMNGPIRAMADGLEVCWGTRALTLKRDDDIWQVDTGEATYTADRVLVTVPAEQAAELLSDAAPELATIAGSVKSEPCWAVMAAFGERLAPQADCVRDSGAPIAWAARNSAKPGRAGQECWVLHASPTRSREVLELPKEEAADVLLADFFAQTGLTPVQPIHIAAHRWLYAMPSAVAGEAARYDTSLGIGIAGDYLHSPRVEGAFLSGGALARLAIASL